jgi:hypothetical protein
MCGPDGVLRILDTTRGGAAHFQVFLGAIPVPGMSTADARYELECS